jgi:hypothetical protein
MRIGKCEVELYDGRVIDLTGKTVDEGIAVLRELGITPLDVRETRHYVDLGQRREQRRESGGRRDETARGRDDLDGRRQQQRRDDE